VYTDQRVGDVAGMWRQDIRGGVIHMLQAKTGKASAIPSTLRSTARSRRGPRAR
jgi:hypothetical protein